MFTRLRPYALSLVAVLATALFFNLGATGTANTSMPEQERVQALDITAETVVAVGARDNYTVTKADPYGGLTGWELCQHLATTAMDRLGGTQYMVFNEYHTQHYGSAIIGMRIFSVNMKTPPQLCDDVAIHEYAHILQGFDYGQGSDVLAHFGSSHEMELDADRRACAMGARWVHYLKSCG